MILNRLVEFAETLNTLAPSGFQPQFVTKVIDIDPHGANARFIQLSKDKRGKRDGENRDEPQEAPRRASGIRARPFADNCEYLLGKVFEGADEAKVQQRHLAWCEVVFKCAEAVSDPYVEAVTAWIQQGGPAQLAQEPLLQPDDYFTISVNGQIVTELPAVRTWWANQTETPESGTCLVTGIDGPVLERMPAMIKGVPDGQMSGTALVSVNFTAGNSYGLEAGYNSPISPDAGEKIGNALNHLLSERIGDELVYTIKVGKIAFVGWSRGIEGQGQLREILDPDDDTDEAELREINRVRNLKEASKSKGQITSVGVQGDLFNKTTDQAGRKRAIRVSAATFPPKIKAENFYMLALSANAARIIVRDFHTMTLGDIIERRDAWFEKLTLASYRKRNSLYQLATSLYREAKDVPPHVINTLAWCALLGKPIPSSILGLAVKRNLAMQGPYTVFKGGGKGLAHARMALIKAALLDDPLLQEELLKNPERKEAFKMLNPTHPEPAYHCGRLLAVLESIQKNAISGLNATVVDRHYGAACASPASVFGTLLTNATRSHMPKIRKEKGGMHTIFEKQLSEVLSALGSDFPRTLSLQQQAIFSLGFYQQKSHDIETAIAKRDAKADAASDSPEESN